MDENTVNRKLLSKALKMENEGTLVDFAWNKENPAEEVPLSVIVIKEGHNLKIPVSLKEIKDLKLISDKLSTTVIDNSSNVPVHVSQRWEVNASQICSTTFKNLSLSSLAFRYVPSSTKLTNVQAQLQNLILFENSGFIHSSDCMIDGKIGTLIIQIPVEGGLRGCHLNVEYRGRKKIFDNNLNSDKNFYISGFYSCCKYFTEPITKGFKLILIFDLIWTNTIAQELPVFLTTLEQIEEALKPWTLPNNYQEKKIANDVICTKIIKEENFSDTDGFHPEKKLKENVLFFILHEKYDIENFAFEFLRGQDRQTAGLLQSCDFLDVHIAIAKVKTKPESCLKSVLMKHEDHEEIEISCLIDSDNVTRNFSIDLNWSSNFVEIFGCDKKKNSGREDCRDAVEFGKAHLENGILVIMPKYQSRQMYCRYGLESFLTSLKIPMEKSLSEIQWHGDFKDFVNQVTGWMDVTELVKPLLSLDRISKQLLPIMNLAKCFLIAYCVQGANLVGDSVSSFFAELHPTCAAKIKESDIEAYIDIVVFLETDPGTSSQSRIALFILFFSKLELSLRCRLLLHFETHFNSEMMNHQSCKELFHSLCLNILKENCYIFTPPVESIVDLINCFIRLGKAEFLQSLISKIWPHVIQKQILETIISSSSIWESATSSELGRSLMALLVNHHLSFLVEQFESSEDRNEDPHTIDNTDDIERVFQSVHLPCSLPSCILFLMEIQNHYDDENSQCLPVRVRMEWNTSLILKQLGAQQLTQFLIDVIKEKPGYLKKHLTSFGTHRTCQLFFTRIQDKVTDMPHRETLLELLNWFIQAGDETLTRSFLEHVCEHEKIGTWNYRQKNELFQMLVSSFEIWVKLASDLKLLVLQTCVDLAVMANEKSNNTLILLDCVLVLFLAEKDQLPDVSSTTAHILPQFLMNISTPQLMDIFLDIQPSEEKEPYFSNFLVCTDWYINAYRFFFKQDFVSFVKSKDETVKKILNCLLWLNDWICWKIFQVRLCLSFPSEEGNLFLQYLMSSEALRQDIFYSPYALNAFNCIIDHWIKHSDPQMELPFPWRQPHAALSDHPRVEIFLRSSKECMTYANFSGFSEACLFGEDLQRNGPANGFSVRGYPGGVGKYAYCEIVKNFCCPSVLKKAVDARQPELNKLVQLRNDLNPGVFNKAKEGVQETSADSLPLLYPEEAKILPCLYVENLNAAPVISRTETEDISTTDDRAVLTSSLDAESNSYIHSTIGVNDLMTLLDNMEADLVPFCAFDDAHVQDSTELWDTILGTVAASELDNGNTALTSTLSAASMSTTSDKASNGDDWCETTGYTWTADSRTGIEEPMTLLQPPDDWVTCADAWASAGDKKTTTTSKAKTSPLLSRWEMLTSSTSSAPPRSGSSWKIPKITKSKINEEVPPKFDAKKVKGRTNLDANISGDWARSKSNRNPSVSGVNAFPIRDGRKTAVNGYTRPCRKCNRTGHSLLQCPNCPIGGWNIEKEPSSLYSVRLAHRTLNENGGIANSMVHRERTSRGDFSNRINVHSCNVRQGQQAQFIKSKPRDNSGTSANALPSCPGSPDEPSISGTRNVIGHVGLNNYEMQHKVIGNIAVSRQSYIEKKFTWNLKEIEMTGKQDELPSRRQYCEMEPQKSNVEASGIPCFNIMENSSHCRVIPALTNIRREKVVQPAVVFHELPTFLRSPTPTLFAEECSVVWKGAIHGSDVGKLNVQALHIKNSMNHFYSLPSSLNVVGRIHPEKIWDYIDRIKCAETNHIAYLKFIPACDSDRENYSYFLCQLQQRDRFAVVKPVSKHIKDVYLISLPAGSRIPSALASLTSVTELLGINRQSSLLVGIVIYNIPPLKNGETGCVTVPLKTDTSIKMIPLEPLSSSIRNAIPRNSPPADLIKTTNPQFMLRTTPPIPITPDVLKNVRVDDLQKILETAQNKEDNSCLRKRKFRHVDTNTETNSLKVVKVATRSSTIPSKLSTLSVKSTPPSSTSSSSTNPIHICTSESKSSIAKNIEAGWLGSQYLNVALYSPGIPMEPFKPIPVIDEDLVKIQDSLMEELNSALPAWLTVDRKNST